MHDKLDLSNTTPNIKASNFKASIKHPEVRATKEQLLEIIANNTGDTCIWDARSKEEYNGTKALAAKGGHIPGAIHLEWTETLDKKNSLRLKDKNNLTKLLTKKGISPEKTVISHCQTHRRSGLTYIVAKLLDYPNNRAYDGSWSEWGNASDTPIEL